MATVPETQVTTLTSGSTTAASTITSDKTFTQDDVNRIVAERVKRYSNYEELKQKAEQFDKLEEANKSELQKAVDRANGLESELNELKNANTLRDMRDEVSKDKGVPANLLTGATKEECEAQAEEIISFAKQKPGYPAVTDGGEPTVTVKKATRDQFADWLNNGGN